MKEDKKRVRKGMSRGVLSCLHLLQHIALVTAIVLIVTVLFGSYMAVDTIDGTESYSISESDRDKKFEDSKLFNKMLGNSVTDIICFGAIRGQMETDAVFDPKKIVDVTAFANRYNGVQNEYITANYYLDDLIKWSQSENGFSYENKYLSGEEADEFLSRTSKITKVKINSNEYSGGTISYLNSDISSYTVETRDVSGNLLESGEAGREDVEATILANRYHTINGDNIENYVSSWDQYYALCANLQKAADDLAINYNEYLKYDDYYNQGNSNIVYYIRKTIGNEMVVFTNDTKNKSKNLADLEQALKANCEKYIVYDPLNMDYETNTLIEEETVRYILNGYEYSYPENSQILIGVDTNYSVMDCFAQGNAKFNNYAPFFWQYLIIALVLVTIYLLLLLLLTMKEGRYVKKDTGEVVIRLHSEDRIPTELMLLAIVGIGFLFYYLSSKLLGRITIIPEPITIIALCGVIALIISLVFNFFYYSMVRRIKAGTLWKNSIIRMIGNKLIQFCIYAYDHGSVLLRVLVPFVILVVAHIILVILALTVSAVFLILLLIADVVIGIILYHSALAREAILEGINRISHGEINYNIKEEGFHGDELILAKAVNNIGNSVQKAVETSMKDERLKADLITNVSHDIKTPLTSIINYVDLIKRENIENTKVIEYVGILDEKSQRLKQLTDDLVEASKISSGNIILQMERINLIELVNQTIGEFSEKFATKMLIPVFDAPKEMLCIEADSRRMWRVMENLFNNIFKYALTGTRVYVEINKSAQTDKNATVSLSVKNISEKPLNISGEELTERFIRGDESRTTEGSGLGLSIAKNLIEVQHGKLDILTDGDLFKVTMTFSLLEQ